MKNFRPLPVLTLTGTLLFACGGGGNGAPPEGIDAASGPDRSEPADGGPDGSVHRPDGGGDGGAGYTAPVVETARVAPVGRDGQHLGIQVQGYDPDGDALVVLIRVLGATGQEVPLFDNNRDGILESGQAALDPGVLAETFIARAVVKDSMRLRPAIARVSVMVRDAQGLNSEPVEVAFEAQPERAAAEGCDEDNWLDRCAAGLGCVDNFCRQGQAPRLSRVGYFNTAQGPRILLDGLDPDDDLDKVSLEFLDSAGQPIVVDLDNDETPESSGFEVQARGMGEHGSFFVEMQPSDNFSAQVPQLAAMPYDLMGQTGDRMTARLTQVPTQRGGQSCDLKGFNTCPAGNVCSPGLPSANNTCQPVAGRRTYVCGRAPQIPLLENTGRLTLRAEGASLWDPPAGCAALDPVNRPEAVARLRLTSPVDRLVISTAQPGTTFDTVLYLLPACGGEPVACNDDAAATAYSELSLSNVAAGEYYLVVDAWAQGGVVGLTVRTEP